MTPEEKVSGQIVDEQTAQIDALTAERDAARAEVERLTAREANGQRNWNALLEASRELVKERDALRARQDKLVEALWAIFPWDDQPDNNGYDQCWCCEAYCEDRCTNPKCGAFKARAALAAIENEVTANGHVADEVGLEEEAMEGGGE